MSELPPSPSEERPTRPLSRPGGSVILPLLLIFAGVVLLLNTTGILPWSAWERIWPLWPVVLILIGLDMMVGRRSAALRLLLGLVILALLAGGGLYLVVTTEPARPAGGEESQAWPIGGAKEGAVSLEMEAGELRLGVLEENDLFARASLSGAEGATFEHSFQDRGSSAHLTLSGPQWETSWLFRSKGDILWQVDLTDRIPLALKIETGVGKSVLDLRRLQVEDLTLSTGVGEVEVILPERVERGEVEIETGVGAVTVIVPAETAVEIELETGIGGVSVDEEAFPQEDDHLYRSKNYATARYRLEVHISGSIGRIRVRSE